MRISEVGTTRVLKPDLVCCGYLITEILREYQRDTLWSLVCGDVACPSLHVTVPEDSAAATATPWCDVPSRRCRMPTNRQTNKQKSPIVGSSWHTYLGRPSLYHTDIIQCDSFGTRPKKMRISQRLFIRFWTRIYNYIPCFMRSMSMLVCRSLTSWRHRDKDWRLAPCRAQPCHCVVW